MRAPLRLRRSVGCALCALAAVGCGGTTLKPVLGQSVLLQPVSGSVQVKPPTSAGFTRLSGRRSVSVGALVDARSGVVRLTAADPGIGKTAVGDFQDGIFEVLQSRSGNGLTDLRIEDTQSAASGCGSTTGSRKLTSHQLGLLLGDGTGQFRTDGDFASATVRGTAWGVRNRCDGTLTIVRHGTVTVTDLRLDKSVTLHTGQTYLAKAP